jgi:hypothetical protein
MMTKAITSTTIAFDAQLEHVVRFVLRNPGTLVML